MLAGWVGIGAASTTYSQAFKHSFRSSSHSQTPMQEDSRLLWLEYLGELFDLPYWLLISDQIAARNAFVPQLCDTGRLPWTSPLPFQGPQSSCLPWACWQGGRGRMHFEPYHVQLLMSTCWSRQAWLQTEASPPFAGVTVERAKCVLGFYRAALHSRACHRSLRASFPCSAAIWDTSMEIFALLS